GAAPAGACSVWRRARSPGPKAMSNISSRRRSRRDRGRPRPAPARTLELEVTDIAGLGDGVATVDGQTVFVPLAAPGDRVRAEVVAGRDGTLRAIGFELLEPGPHRVVAPCRHFGTCGGCALQHLEPAFYAGWKRGIVRSEERRVGKEIGIGCSSRAG